MTNADLRNQTTHRWYTRPVFFVADVNRALGFYVDTLGFEKRWHEGNGAGGVCQVNHGECEIILCEDAARRDRRSGGGTTRSRLWTPMAMSCCFRLEAIPVRRTRE